MSFGLGVNPSFTFPHAEHEPGSIADLVNEEFIFAKYTMAVDLGEIVLVDTANEAQPLDLTLATTNFGTRIGVCAASVESGDYGWVQVRGDVAFQSDGDATANTQLYATATAGQIGITEEDDGALSGIVLTEDATGMAGLVAGRLLNPVAGAATGSGGGGGGGSGSGVTFQAGDTVTNLYEGEIAVANNYNPLATGVDVPQEGYVRIYVEVRSGTNRDGAVGSATFPAERLYAAQRTAGTAPSADQGDNRTVPIGANRFVGFARDGAAGSDALMVTPQDGNTDGMYFFKIDHIEPGAEVSVSGAIQDISGEGEPEVDEDSQGAVFVDTLQSRSRVRGAAVHRGDGGDGHRHGVCRHGLQRRGYMAVSAEPRPGPSLLPDRQRHLVSRRCHGRGVLSLGNAFLRQRAGHDRRDDDERRMARAA